MKCRLTILGAILALLTGCKQVEKHNGDTSLRDSIVRKHFFEAGKTDGYDTTDINYQFLKAYIDHDTRRLLELSKMADAEKIERETLAKRDSFLHLSPLKELGMIEVYRFDYWEAFCPNQVSITILKKQDSAYLHFVLYKPKMILKNEYLIIKEYNGTVRQQEWDTFSNLLSRSDFWGLKETNDVMGFDGDGLTVVGYKRKYLTTSNPVQYNRVYRWSVSSSILADPYSYLLRLSGIGDTCIEGL